MTAITEARLREIVREELKAWWKAGGSVSALRQLGLRDGKPTLEPDHGLDEPDDSDADVEVERAEVVVVLQQLQVLDQLGADGQVVRYRGQLWVLDHDASPSSVGSTPTVGVEPDAGSGVAPASGAPTPPLAGSAAEIGLRLANRALAFGSKAAADYAGGLAGTVLRQRTCCPTTAGDEHMVQCPAWQPGLTVEEIAHLRATVLKGVVSS